MKDRTEFCPVCDMSVNVNNTTLTSEYKDREYALCGPGCKKKFDREPDQFAVGLSSMVGKGRAIRA